MKRYRNVETRHENSTPYRFNRRAGRVAGRVGGDGSRAVCGHGRPERRENAADTLILVARPQVQDAIYGASVIVARSLQDGTYIGFMLNKPTTMTLGKLFPKDRPATGVADAVFLGGPESMNVIFALVARHGTPGAGSIEIAPDLFLAINGEVVDRIIASEAGHARFFAGVVIWRPGELNEELKRGLWYELEPDAGLVLRKQTAGMWEELVGPLEIARNAI